MTSAPLLTIIVPTYNRAECLELLLTTLAREMAELEGRVGIIVGDNASTDRTPDVTSAFAASAPAALVIRHDANLGPDENFCRCVERVTSRYFWIIGDDDLPRAGAIRHVLELLATHSPDLVYLESDWRPEIRDNDPHDPVRDEAPDLMVSLRFARRVHVWTTFISGIVVDRESLVAKQPPEQLRRYSNTSLVQLGWVLGTLKAGTRFLVVRQKCILATQGNTGGYSVLKVFGNNFPSIVSDALGADSPLRTSDRSTLCRDVSPQPAMGPAFLDDREIRSGGHRRRDAPATGAPTELLAAAEADCALASGSRGHGAARVRPAVDDDPRPRPARLPAPHPERDGMNVLTVLAKGPAMLGVLARSWLWQRIMGAPGIELQQGCQILGHRHIRIGRDFRAGRLLWLEAVTEFGPQTFAPQLIIGERVSCSDGVHIACATRLTIGNDVLIGSKVHITDHNHGNYRDSALHSSPDVPPAKRALAGAPVEIGDRVFLAADGVVVPAR